jgi:hypothetical protein
MAAPNHNLHPKLVTADLRARPRCKTKSNSKGHLSFNHPDAMVCLRVRGRALPKFAKRLGVRALPRRFHPCPRLALATAICPAVSFVTTIEGAFLCSASISSGVSSRPRPLVINGSITSNGGTVSTTRLSGFGRAISSPYDPTSFNRIGSFDGVMVSNTLHFCRFVFRC